MRERKTRLDDSELKHAAGLIRGSDSVMLLGHQYPDGDAIGSILALAIALTNQGHEVIASWPDPFDPPPKYGFLPGQHLLTRPEDVRPADVTVTLDCSNPDRLVDLKGAALNSNGLINIDHHPDNTLFGTVNLVDSKASATAEIVYTIGGALGLTWNQPSALCLYTGIVTDTGRFQFSNTTTETLNIAAEMVTLGVEPNTVYERVYQSDSLEYIRLSGQVMMNAVYDLDLELVYGWLLQEDLKRFGVKMNETEDLIDELRALKGHRVVALFKELPDGTIRVSLRSRADTDIGGLARRFGGGGHRVAAGYTSESRSIEEAIEELKGELSASYGRDNTG